MPIEGTMANRDIDNIGHIAGLIYPDMQKTIVVMEISPCMKRWGIFKETAMGKSGSKSSDIKISEDILEDFVPEPSGLPATPIDAVIDPEEGMMFRYLE